MTERSPPIEIGFIVFPNVQQLDLTGPCEVFASWPRARLRLVGQTLDPVVSSTKLVLTPDETYEACPQLDVLCIPGGAGTAAALTRSPLPYWVGVTTPSGNAALVTPRQFSQR